MVRCLQMMQHFVAGLWHVHYRHTAREASSSGTWLATHWRLTFPLSVSIPEEHETINTNASFINSAVMHCVREARGETYNNKKRPGSFCCYCISRSMTREVIMKEVGVTNEGRQHLWSLHKQVHDKTMKGLGLINEGRQHLLLLCKQNINFVSIWEEYQDLGNILLEEPLQTLKGVFSEVKALIWICLCW